MVLVALIVGAAARADLMPARELDADPAGRALSLYHLDLPNGDASCRLADLIAADLGTRSGGLLPEDRALREPHSPMPHLHILTDRPNGAGLCLCAFMGLALCKAAPRLKRLSCGVIPDWYHDGGPYQIGHSLALSPDGFDSAPACFVQPKDPGAGFPSPYRGEIVVLRWCQPPFILTVLAPRGPPLCFSQTRLCASSGAGLRLVLHFSV